MEYLTHITKDKDRWDALAYKYYGDALNYAPIVAANPHVKICSVLTAGIYLKIPIIETGQTYDDDALPPWKR